MSANGGLCHIVITPSRNEHEQLPSLIETMSKQTIPPSRWVIVNHNSQDSTMGLLAEICDEFDWISTITVNDSSKRRRGSQIAKLFNAGMSIIEEDWQFCSKIDADMTLPNDYFEKIFSEFAKSENLGVASGSCFVVKGSKKIYEMVPQDHTRGGLKTYRRECFDEIGGVKEVNGWDGIDNITAQMKGWETKHFPDIEVEHKRLTGAYSGLTRGCFETGQFAYSMRYFPPFLVARCIHRMARRPFIIGGISMFAGYCHAFLSRHSASCGPETNSFLRKKQKRRILFWRSKSN